MIQAIPYRVTFQDGLPLIVNASDVQSALRAARELADETRAHAQAMGANSSDVPFRSILCVRPHT